MEKIIDIEEAQRLRKEKRDAAVSKRKIKPEPEVSFAAVSAPQKKGNRLASYGRGAMLIVAAVAVIAFVLVSTVNLIHLSAEADAAELQLAEKAVEKAQIEKKLTLVNDPAFIEEQAREHLRMIRTGETLYVFGDPNDESDR